MSREILFRAWHEEHKSMVYFDPQVLKRDPYQGAHLAALMCGDHGDVLMQFTGLLDSEEKKIFEGDLLRINITSEKYQEYSFDGIYAVIIGYKGVEFKYIKLAWEDGDKNQHPIRTNIRSEFIYERWFNVGKGCHFNEYDKGETKSTSIKICGNIFEDKELLEEG